MAHQEPKKINDLDSAATVSGDDLIIVVVDPTGVNATKTATVDIAKSYITAGYITTSVLSSAVALLATHTAPVFTGDASFNTDTLFVDATENKVGIGTTTPDQELTVNGNLKSDELIASGHLKLRSPTNDMNIYLNSTGDGLLSSSEETLQIVRQMGGSELQLLANGGTGTFKFMNDIVDASLTGATTAEALDCSGVVSGNEFHSAGGHLKFKADTNDAIWYFGGVEQFQLTRHSSGDTHFTSQGGSKGFSFNGPTDVQSLKINGTEVTASVAALNYVDLTSSAQAQLDSKAAANNSSLTGTTTAEEVDCSGISSGSEFHSAGGHLKFKADTNDAIYYFGGTEQFQITKHSGGDTHFTSQGGSKGFSFNGPTNLESLKINGTEITATAAALNYVDATSSVQTQLNGIQSDVDQNESDADTAIALKANIASPTFTGTVDAANITATDKIIAEKFEAEGHLKLYSGGTNDMIVYLNNSEAIQATLSGTQVRWTAHGGSGDFRYISSVTMDEAVDCQATIAEIDAISNDKGLVTKEWVEDKNYSVTGSQNTVALSATTYTITEASGTRFNVDVSNNVMTVDLPATPTDGDIYYFYRVDGSYITGAITFDSQDAARYVGGGSVLSTQTIQSVDIHFGKITLEWYDTTDTWLLY